MVAQDQVTAWDLKPNRENTNKVFNVLCNVQPVEHPWSGDGYARKIDVTTGSKDQFWFEKCKGLKKCKIYEYDCFSDHVEFVEPEAGSSKQRRNAALWGNSNFTDVVVFGGYRIYMRKNNVIVNPYGTREKKDIYGNTYVEKGGDGDEDTCDHMDKKEYTRSEMKRPTEKIEQYPSDRTVTTERLDDNKVNTFNTSSGKIRLYIQQIDTETCTGDTFDDPDEAPIVLVKEYEAAECNPDHFIMGYGGIGAPRIIDVDDGASIYMIRYGGQSFAFLAINDTSIEDTDAVYIDQLGIYVTGLSKPEPLMQSILDELGIDKEGYMIPDFSGLVSVGLKIPDTKDDEINDYKETEITDPMHIYTEYGEIPYFATGEKLRAIHGFFSLKDGEGCNIPDDEDIYENLARGRDWEDATGCQVNEVDYQKKRIFIYDTVIQAATNTSVITGLAKRGARIAYVNSTGGLYVSGNGQYIGVYGEDPTAYITANGGVGDIARGYHRLPSGVTDVKTIGSSLLFLGPKVIYVTANELTLAQGNFVSGTDNEDGYYSPGSYHNDDGEFLLARRGKVLGTLQIQVSYNNSISLSFDPSTGFYINSHFKSLNNNIDKINIDANINYRYMSIYDNNIVGPHYSKLLIYDKHYNCRYWRMITGARIVHVKDNIFLGDGIYANKGRTWGREDDDTKGGEIIEIISAYVGEEGLQTPKHIQYVKTAIGDHSVISYDSLWDIDTSYGGRLYRRRNNITATRYPNLLVKKENDKSIETYEIGEEIYGHGKLLSHNLLNEISEYRNYDKFSNTIIREMGEESDMTSELALFASIKEPVNAPANVLELCISARHLDNVQFGSFYIGYYQLDADYEDIANTNIDTSDASDLTEESTTVINKGEYCEEILDGSACDVPPAGSF